VPLVRARHNEMAGRRASRGVMIAKDKERAAEQRQHHVRQNGISPPGGSGLLRRACLGDYCTVCSIYIARQKRRDFGFVHVTNPLPLSASKDG
jgi:hypothetical protein